MVDMVKVRVVGNLGGDPEIRYTQDGTEVMRFSLAGTSRTRERNDSGEYDWTDHTDWYRVTMWRPSDTVKGRLSKGARVLVEGPLVLRKYTTADGREGSSLDVTARDLILLSSS